MAGFLNDLGKFVVDGGFWNAGDVARHAFGEDNVYESYNKQIENLFYTQGMDAAFNKAEEALKYAREKNNVFQISRFYIYACLIGNNGKEAVEASEILRKHLKENYKDIQYPVWYLNFLSDITYSAINEYISSGDHKYLSIAYEHASIFNHFAFGTKDIRRIQHSIYLFGIVYSYMDCEEEYFKRFEEAVGDLRKDGYNVDISKIKDKWRKDKLYSKYIS